MSDTSKKKYKPDYTSHGNYKCPYCNHKVWKTQRPAIEHIERLHKAEAIESFYIVENDRLQRENQQLKEKEPAKPKKEYYDAVWYCSNCLHVHSGGLPKGVLVANVSCGCCGVCSLHLVENVDRFWEKA